MTVSPPSVWEVGFELGDVTMLKIWINPFPSPFVYVVGFLQAELGIL